MLLPLPPPKKVLQLKYELVRQGWAWVPHDEFILLAQTDSMYKLKIGVHEVWFPIHTENSRFELITGA